MKKVLIIAAFWPYRHGTIRTGRLAKYLPEFGWQSIILTPPLDTKPDPQFSFIETPYRDIQEPLKRLLRLAPERDPRKEIKKRFGITSEKSFMDFFLTIGATILNYPDAEKGWKPFAIKAGSELLQNEHIDAMISIKPAIKHIIASELKARYKIPWIADFPDLWSQDHNYTYGPLRRLIDRRLEVKTISKADAIVTVSKPWAERLGTLHKEKPIYVITHGFDPAEVNSPPVELTPKFTITYTGSVFVNRQDPSKLFAALRDLFSSGTMNPGDIEVRFYGPELNWLTREIEKYGLSGTVKQYGKVPRQVVLEKQRESQLFLLLKWENPQEKGWHSGKIYEYLAARRPILAIGGSDDVVTQLLKETNAGIDAPTIEDIKKALQNFYHEYKLNGKIGYKGEEAKINKYSCREMARKFSEILNHLV